MTDAPATLPELCVAALTRPIPEEGLPVGRTGTVVHVYAEGGPYMVEFVNRDGSTDALLDLTHDDLRMTWRLGDPPRSDA